MTFVDSVLRNPMGIAVQDGRDNDLYIGNTDRLSVEEWWDVYEERKDDEDAKKSVLVYTTHQNPDDESEERGLRITNLRFLYELSPGELNGPLDPVINEQAFMEIVVEDLGNSRISKDVIYGIDRVELGRFADVYEVDRINFGKPVTVDAVSFDAGDTTQREYDTVDFSKVGEADDDTAHGLNYVNGIATLRPAIEDRASLGDLFELGFFSLEAAENGLVSIDPEKAVNVAGFEQIIGTEHADVIISGDIPYLEDLFGLELKGSPTRIGEIQAGDGEDVIMVFNPQWIRERETVPEELGGAPESEGGTTAQRDLRMIVDGGADGDWVFAAGGEGAVTIGGTGRDWIYNASRGGIIVGDTRDGVDPENRGDSNPFNKKDRDGDDVYDHSDLIWFWGSTVMIDPKNDDILSFFGYRLAGGSNELPFIFGTKALKGVGGASFGLALAEAFSPIFWDPFMPFITYWLEQQDRTLYVTNIFQQLFERFIDPEFSRPGIGGVMTFVNYDGAKFLEDTSIFGIPTGNEPDEEEPVTDLGIILEVENPLDELFAMLPGFPGGLNRFSSIVSSVITLARQAARLSKVNDWFAEQDPLVIDLDGDGIETLQLDELDVYFDLDNDFFRERTGWLDGDDGFVVLDRNENGRIDDVSEMFGGRTGRGLEDLAAFDANADGVIDVADAIYSELRIWQDFDSDGETDEGELSTLAELGIISIGLDSIDMDITTPQGARLIGSGDVMFADGEMRASFEAIFDASDLLTEYAGEKGTAVWILDDPLDAKGYGNMADLSVVMSNDFDMATTARAAAEAMTTPNLRTLVEQAGDTLGLWAFSLDRTRELTAVLLDTSGENIVLADRAIYTEDATGGYWQLESGADVLDALGAVVDRPTIEDIMAQTTGPEQMWQVEQVWSPSSRAEALQHREAAPYLASIVNDRVLVLDYGIQLEDGSWKLASGTPIVDENDDIIPFPTRDDILALAVGAGQEWRVEEIGFNPYGQIDVERIGVNFIDGIAVDYTVKVTDSEGSFFVWARNLDRALEIQFYGGDAREFDLRSFAVDFDTLDEVNSTDDSTFRVEMMTPGQFHYAVSLYGIDFVPNMLSASIDAGGVIDYSTNANPGYSLSETEFVSGVDAMIELTGFAMQQYIVTSRAFAVKLAVQGGLSDFFREISYDIEADQFGPTSDRELAPMFRAIFEAAPAGAEAVYDYLTEWSLILQEFYPDYKPSGEGNDFGATVGVDQKFVFQMLLPAFEDVGVDTDLAAVLNALKVDETRLRTHEVDAEKLDGTSGIDYIYVTGGDQTYKGGRGSDFYFIGKDFGNDVIEDVDFGKGDEIRFSHLRSSDIEAERDGEDLILTAKDGSGVLTVRNHFLGELNPKIGNRTVDTGVSAIIFADGVVWDVNR
ncbi:MAG: calcium-binding protein, partial [Pseudomonadota bacterium]